VWNLHSRPLSSRIIRYVRDGRTDGQTDGRTKATIIAPFPTVGGIIVMYVYNEYRSYNHKDYATERQVTCLSQTSSASQLATSQTRVMAHASPSRVVSSDIDY